MNNIPSYMTIEFIQRRTGYYNDVAKFWAEKETEYRNMEVSKMSPELNYSFIRRAKARKKEALENLKYWTDILNKKLVAEVFK